MEMMDNDFTIRNGNTHFSNTHHVYLQHHQQVDPFSMSYIQAPLAHPDPHHHLATSFHQHLDIPSSELSHKKSDKSGSSRKRKRSHNESRAAEGLKPSDVIHVRAKRGQATDSHSLAERVRRKKINEKLKGLHDIVPGCHKTMGMAVMLDVVIKYIQSLQNQIEFLSMKLLAASLFHDLNSSDMDVMEVVQGQPHGAEAREMERIDRAEGYGGGGGPYFNSNMFPPESFQNQ